MCIRHGQHRDTGTKPVMHRLGWYAGMRHTDLMLNLMTTTGSVLLIAVCLLENSPVNISAQTDRLDSASVISERDLGGEGTSPTANA